MTIFFTSDQHFGHENIIRFCSRPFQTVTEMDDALVAAWNSVVKPNDIVWHLGDFTLNDGKFARAMFFRLNGLINVIDSPWHHDRRWTTRGPFYSNPDGDTTVGFYGPMHIIQPGAIGLPIVLCHYPLAQWDRKHHGSWHLHGHSHGTYQGDGKILDVGVDNISRLFGTYAPISLEQVEEYMLSRSTCAAA